MGSPAGRALAEARPGVNAHRMSLSWSRIIPTGGRNGAVNEKGIDFYRNVLQSLRRAGIVSAIKGRLQPDANETDPIRRARSISSQDATLLMMQTLYHWDLPQALQDNYKGFLSREIIADFEHYAQICFERLGDLVDYWFTINGIVAGWRRRKLIKLTLRTECLFAAWPRLWPARPGAFLGSQDFSRGRLAAGAVHCRSQSSSIARDRGGSFPREIWHRRREADWTGRQYELGR